MAGMHAWQAAHMHSMRDQVRDGHAAPGTRIVREAAHLHRPRAPGRAAMSTPATSGACAREEEGAASLMSLLLEGGQGEPQQATTEAGGIVVPQAPMITNSRAPDVAACHIAARKPARCEWAELAPAHIQSAAPCRLSLKRGRPAEMCHIMPMVDFTIKTTSHSTTPPRSDSGPPPHPNCYQHDYWGCLLNQQETRSMRRRHPAPPVTAHRAAPAAPHCEQQPVVMATGASPSTAGVQTASYAAGSGHSGPKAPPPRSTATTAQIPAQVKVQTATQPRLDHKERERSHPIPTEPPLVRCPLCDDGSSEKPPYVTQRRKRSMAVKRRRLRLGMWWKKYGYGGPPYCQRCSEVFRDHIIRGLSNSAKCTPANPCLDCKKVLQHFPKSHPLVKG
jgi:hypothetical protein